MKRVVTENIRKDNWKGYAEFMKKREIRNIIGSFNKKPVRGIKKLLSLFELTTEKSIFLSQSQISEREQ